MEINLEDDLDDDDEPLIVNHDRNPEEQTRAEEPVPNSVAEKPASQVFDDSNCCSICQEPWTAGGEHAVSALRCGHLFGRSCILQWLRTQAGANAPAHCPQCRQRYVQNHACLSCLYVSSVPTVSESSTRLLTRCRGTHRSSRLQHVVILMTR